jgi:hypothetical protein
LEEIWGDGNGHGGFASYCPVAISLREPFASSGAAVMSVKSSQRLKQLTARNVDDGYLVYIADTDKSFAGFQPDVLIR